MKRYCFVCKEAKEFDFISIPIMMITLNRHKALQHCLKCKTVVFIEASEEVEVVEKKRFFSREMEPVGAAA